MKAEEILGETPYLHPGEMSRKMLDQSISLTAISREYLKIGTIDSISILLDTEQSSCIGIDANSSVIEDRIIPVFTIVFKSNHLLEFKHSFVGKIKQIDKTAIHRGRGNRGVISAVYKMLVDSGFTLVSDVTQFEPAQALWKKIATDSEYITYVADLEYGIFKDVDGKEIVYNGENISDTDIWTTGSDFNGQYRVLILVKNTEECSNSG